MAGALKDNLWTSAGIQKILDEKGKEGNEWFAKKFKRILERLEINIDYFKSESSSGGGGRFIFSGEDAPLKIKEVFDIYDENDGIMTLKETRIVAENLKEILPIERRADKVEELLKRSCEMREGRRKLEFSEEDFAPPIENPKCRIEYAVENAYMRIIRQPSFFYERIFVPIDGTEINSTRVRAAIYEYQYELMKDWFNKWSFIMDAAERIRVVEEFDMLESANIGVDYCRGEQHTITKECLYDYLADKFESGKSNQPDDTDKKESEAKPGTKEECKEKCGELVSNILSVNLKKYFEGDFDYMLTIASKELEDIRSRVILKWKMEAYMLKKGRVMEEEWKMLDEMRKTRPRINVIDAQRRLAFLNIAKEKESKE